MNKGRRSNFEDIISYLSHSKEEKKVIKFEYSDLLKEKNDFGNVHIFKLYFSYPYKSMTNFKIETGDLYILREFKYSLCAY